MSTAASSPSFRDPMLPRVLVFQPAVKHYRLPFWDALVEQAAGHYQIAVLGPLDLSAEAVAARPYLHEFPFREQPRFGRMIGSWPGAADVLRRERPAVVLLTATASFSTSWSLPRQAHRAGAKVIGWSKVSPRAGTKRGLLARTAMRMFVRRFDRFLCYGQSSVEQLAALGYPPERIRVAPNTIDTRRVFSGGDVIRARGQQLREQHGLADKRVVLYIGRMIERKRPWDLLGAWPKLRTTQDDTRLVLVGGGPMLDEIRRRVKSIDPERVVVTGPVPEGDDYAWIAAADVVVLPAAVGLAINQALALGTPLVIADEPGADAELVKHGQTGWRFEPRDTDELAAAVHRIFNHTKEREAVVARGLALMQSEYALQRMVEVFDATIRECL
ncbi:MAG: glycosyltransferase family 4 protein [Pirellulales bacterium]|nr:glycosyltransferase family 4 protein [Pirellulales bacterium]